MVVSYIFCILFAIGTISCTSFEIFKKSAAEAQSVLYEPDLTELILLAGHRDGGNGLNLHGLKKLGWERGIEIISVESIRGCLYVDRVFSWKKDTHCIAAFSSADDVQDEVLEKTGTNGIYANTTDFCGFDVNAFVVSELLGLQRNSDWKLFLDYFNQTECETVTSVGHGLGGAIATVFAACANKRQKHFGQRADFGLITFGNSPVSLQPIYSGMPGVPFRGTRYHVTGLDGNLDLRSTLPTETRQLRVLIFELCRAIATSMGDNEAAGRIQEAKFSMSTNWDVEQFWGDRNISSLLFPYFHKTKEVYLGYTEDYRLLEIRPFFYNLMKKLTQHGEILYYYDPISAHMLPYGYKHALVDYQPISNSMLGFFPLPRVPAENAVELPKVDTIFTALGMMNRVSNHQTCCYFRGKGCIYHFLPGPARMLKGCQIPVLR